MAKVLKITQVKSSSKLLPNQAATLKSLGLRGMGSQVIRQDLRAIRGMLNVLQHVITAEQIDEAEAKKDNKKASRAGYKVA